VGDLGWTRHRYVLRKIGKSRKDVIVEIKQLNFYLRFFKSVLVEI